MAGRRGRGHWKSDRTDSGWTDDKNPSNTLYSDNMERKNKFSQRRVSFKPTVRAENSQLPKYLKNTLIDDDEVMGVVRVRETIKKHLGKARRDNIDNGIGNKRVSSPIPLRFGNSLGWYEVVIPYGHKYEKQTILINLMNEITPDLFIPLYWKQETNRVVFYLDDRQMAEKLQRLDKTIRMPDGYKLLLKVRSAIPQVRMDEKLKERMKMTMSKRYNITTKALDLSKFHADDDLKDTFCGLLRPAVMLAAIEIMAENIPQLEALNLNDNLIMQCDQFKRMAERLPCLKTLYLDGNRINSMAQLNALKGIQLIELAVKRNPFAKNYRGETYVSELRKKFPKLRKLDGQDLDPIISFEKMDPSELPTPKASFLIDASGAEIMRQFIHQYFVIFDSDNRQPLIDAYHEQAMLSLSAACNQSRLSHYAPYVRNLKSYDPKMRNRAIRFGKLPAISLLIELPKTQHDPQSFTVDLTLCSPKIMAFTVTGVFKEFSAEYSDGQPEIRSFARSFIIVPFGNGFCIRNELYLISNVTMNQLKTAFKSTDHHQQANTSAAVAASAAASISPSTSSIHQAIPSTSTNIPPSAVVPNDVIKMQMIQTLAEQTKMNLEWSRKCLDETNWEYNYALHAFTELQMQNKIPPEAFIK